MSEVKFSFSVLLVIITLIQVLLLIKTQRKLGVLIAGKSLSPKLIRGRMLVTKPENFYL